MSKNLPQFLKKTTALKKWVTAWHDAITYLHEHVINYAVSITWA